MDYPSFVNGPNSWRNTLSTGYSFWESGSVRPILVSGMFACGFHCSFVDENCLFAVSIGSSKDNFDFSTQVVWSANRKNPVQMQALLELTSEGKLNLKDANDIVYNNLHASDPIGTTVWSPSTPGKSISRLNLTSEGNLMLFNETNYIVWQSFDHPTDTLVRGQRLVPGQKLKASVSPDDPIEGLYAFAVSRGVFTANMDLNPPQIYYERPVEDNNSDNPYVEFKNKRFGSFYVGDSGSFIQLGSDGHLKAYELTESGWEGIDLLDLDQLFSIEKNYSSDYYSNSAFIKVQNYPEKKRQNGAVIVASTLGAVLVVLLICGLFFLRAEKGFEEAEEHCLDNMLGMPTRFSYEELKNITKNFSNKLGEGGFGSVFHGILPLGSDVAVKHQFNFGAVNKSFIAEVQTIGSIHHFNLVSLVGFCAESSNKLLVYEYMANGSLDRWIFNQNRDLALGWQIRRKIILDIAKGFWVVEVNRKRPKSSHNNYRGTPGYMAPEWLSSCITEKVDVYSFGIVVLEILCGRRNVDESQQEEDMHLLGLFKRKQEEGQLMDLVDKCSDDMQSNAAEVVELMKVAAWCLQTEYARRPSMSTVVKLFEASVDVTGGLNEDFLNGLTLEPVDTFPSIVLSSMLSGPR
ncbi:hypothetical protein GOBAR_DD11903 [Gossypium barbadense]|nr:hypothetical protein GOBAR_DD11903 [Gossypium barbadense]